MIGDRRGGWWGWFRFGRRGELARPADAVAALGGWPRPEEPSDEVMPAADRDVVRHILDVLCAAGVFAGSSPDPVYLYPSLVEEGLPVRVEGVLFALGEADVLYADVRLDDFSPNLVHHAFQVEQFADALEMQVADLARLTAGAIAVVLERIEQTSTAEGLRTRVWLTIDGVRHLLDYLGHPKRMSTVVHVEVARALRATGSSQRLAWLWSNSGPWITVLTADVAQLNADLGIDPDDPECFSWWTWVDEEAPLVAGDVTTD